MSRFAWRRAVWLLRSGGVIAYPTESVYGLGCDPCNGDAILELLAIKRRDWRKGLILVASEIEQLKPWLAPLPQALEEKVQAAWPGPVTWLLPSAANVSPLICGIHESVAVRVSDHPVVRGLCDTFGGAIISTSANLSTQLPCRSTACLRNQFGGSIDFIVPGKLGGQQKPTTIRNAITDEWLRQ